MRVSDRPLPCAIVKNNNYLDITVRPAIEKGVRHVMICEGSSLMHDQNLSNTASSTKGGTMPSKPCWVGIKYRPRSGRRRPEQGQGGRE